jgi:hypothetical protein
VVDLAVFFAFFFAVTAIDRTPDFSLQTIYCFRLKVRLKSALVSELQTGLSSA